MKENIDYFTYDGTVEDLEYRVTWLLQIISAVDEVRERSTALINDAMRSGSCVARFESFIDEQLG